MSVNNCLNGLEHLSIEQLLASGALIQPPGSEDIYLGVTPTESSESFFYFAPFYAQKLEKYYYKQIFKTTKEQLLKFLQKHNLDKIKLKELKTFDHEFVEDVEYILNTFKNDKKLKKVVACTKSTLSKANDGEPLVNLLSSNMNGAIYALWNNDQGIMGITPEPLYLKQNDLVTTFAIAGSAKMESVDLLQSTKDLEEHNWVIKDIQEKLKDKCTEFNIEKTKLTQYGNIQHLKTQINLKTQSNYDELVFRMSPTSALGGYPKDKCMKVLKNLKYMQHDKEKRRFGGVFGFYLNKQIQFSLVCIRNIILKGSVVEIHSGAGIVEKSNIQSELKEVQMKRKSIQELFQ